MKPIVSVICCVIVLSIAIPAYTRADTPVTGSYDAPGFVPLAQTPSGSKLGQLYNTSGDFSNFINSAFKFALALGAIGAVLRIAYAGFLYMGSDMWSKKGKAKEILGEVTLGLLLLLAVYLILYQINPDIVKMNALKNIQSNPVKPTTAAPTGAAGTGVGSAPY